jgi:hypothetical protein
MYPAEAISERMAVADTVIPLGDGIRTSKGQYISHLPVRKGQIVNLGIASYQQFVSPGQWSLDQITQISFTLLDSNRAGGRMRTNSNPLVGSRVEDSRERPLVRMQICELDLLFTLFFHTLRMLDSPIVRRLSFLGGPRTCLG